MSSKLEVALLAVLASGAAARSAAAAESCGDLLIVYDRSGSMADCRISGESKEAIAKRAMKAMLEKFRSVPMGLYVFPDTLDGLGCSFLGCPGACKGGRLVVDLAPDGASKIAAYLDGMPRSAGGTPTGDTMQRVKDHDKWTPGRSHYVLLLTDGVPTCQDGDDGMGKLCDGMGMKGCPNPTKVYDGIRALFERVPSIHTFVVGFEGKDEGCPTGGFMGKSIDPAILDRMADLGGEPSPSGPTKFYSATDEATLLSTLEKILGKVAGATVSGCVAGGSPRDGGGAGGSGGGAPDGSGQETGAGQDAGGAGGIGGGSGRGADVGCMCSAPGRPDGCGSAAAAWALLLAGARFRRSVGRRAEGASGARSRKEG